MTTMNHNQPLHRGSPRWAFQRFFLCHTGRVNDPLTVRIDWFANKDGIRHALRAKFAGRTTKMILHRTPKQVDLMVLADEA